MAVTFVPTLLDMANSACIPINSMWWKPVMTWQRVKFVQPTAPVFHENLQGRLNRVSVVQGAGQNVDFVPIRPTKAQ